VYIFLLNQNVLDEDVLVKERNTHIFSTIKRMVANLKKRLSCIAFSNWNNIPIECLSSHWLVVHTYRIL